MKYLVLALLLAGQVTTLPSRQIVQAQHNPVACARTDSFLPDGTPVHACTCKRMGHGDGEDCEPDHEPTDCKAYCKGELCTCPIVCDVPETGSGDLPKE